MALLFVSLVGCGSGVDAEAEKACAAVADVDGGRPDLVDSVVTTFEALGAAEKSKSEGLREAAESTTPASDLPRDSPASTA